MILGLLKIAQELEIEMPLNHCRLNVENNVNKDYSLQEVDFL